MNWRHLEPPDPLDALMNGRTRPMPGPQDDPNRVVTHCETCGVPMSAAEVAYSGPRFCVDCAETANEAWAARLQQTDQEPW
jgi:hypothetical protein